MENQSKINLKGGRDPVARAKKIAARSKSMGKGSTKDIKRIDKKIKDILKIIEKNDNKAIEMTDEIDDRIDNLTKKELGELKIQIKKLKDRNKQLDK